MTEMSLTVMRRFLYSLVSWVCMFPYPSEYYRLAARLAKSSMLYVKMYIGVCMHIGANC